MLEHLTETSSLGELCSLSLGLKVLYKGTSKQWVVDVMEKVFCRNPRHNGFGLLKPFILFYRWHSLAGSWAKNQPGSPETSQRPFMGMANLTVSWLGSRTSLCVGQWSLSHGHLCWLLWGCPKQPSEVTERSSSTFQIGSSQSVLVRDSWIH